MADNEPLWNRPAVTTIPSVLWQWFVWSNFSSSVLGLQSFLLLTGDSFHFRDTRNKWDCTGRGKDYTDGEVQLSVFSINETTQENSLQGICSPVSLLCPALCHSVSLCLSVSSIPSYIRGHSETIALRRKGQTRYMAHHHYRIIISFICSHNYYSTRFWVSLRFLFSK